MIAFSIEIIDGKRWYICKEEFTYWSPRYDKEKTVKEGYKSDGASGAIDICSVAWFVHDVLKDDKTWDDGSVCSNYQASHVIGDILKEEGRWFRCKSWFVATLGWGELTKLWR